jgi:stage II sporulation protein AA (anti-sigma F factor antagonist)
MGRYKLMKEIGGDLYLINIASHLKKVMILAGLDRLAIMDRPERHPLKPVENGGNKQ